MKRWRDIDGFQIELPYELSAVRSFRIVRKFNDHTRCYISTTMSEEQADICLRNGTYRDSLLIRKSAGQGNEYLFAGGISNIDIQMEDGIPHVTIEGLSRTYEMDRHLESRSFQNKSLTYTDLIRQIANLYPGGDAQNEATPPEATIRQLLVQYEETNWQFLKRLASRIGTVILPDIVMDAPRVYFGVPDFSWGKVIRSHHYSIIKDRGNFLDIQANSDANSALGESDFVSYRVHTNQYCQVGDNVSFKGQMWVVTESVITYESGLIYYEYVLMQRAALRRKVRTNRALQGVALEGRVIKRGNNMVKVHLDIDHDHDERGNWWFPYSPEGNNIFHCMPEKGARIKVYFPEGTEKKAIAINSVRGRNEEMKSRTVFQKPMTKVFHMPGAAKMELGEDGVLFEKNTVSLTLDGNDISLSATESILVVASNEIELGGQNMPEHIKLVANETITFFTNTDHYMEIRPEYVGIKGKKVNLEKVEMDFLDMLTDEELEKLYADNEYSKVAIKRAEAMSNVPAGTYIMPSWTEEDNQKIRDDATARFRDPATRNDAKESLRGLGDNELKKRYQEKFIPPPPKAKRKSDKERAQEQQEYAEFYQNYVDIRSGKKAPPKQPISPWKAVKDQLPIKELKAHIEKQANHNEALQGLVNVSKALSGSIGKWGDRWEERREEHQLNELIPLVPDYLSKIPDEEIYFSRFTFEELVVKQQKLMTELNLLFGAVAVVGAFFTAGGSLYLLAIANGVWGVAQIGVSTMKLRDLNDGVVSDTSFLGINQGMLDVTGLMLGAVDLAILGKTLLKGANKAANNKYMKGIDQVSPPKTRFKRGQDRRQKEMAMRVRQAVEESKAIRKASKDKRDLYFKKEKELYEALKKKKASSSGSFEGTGKTSESYLSPEMEQKILGGERIPGKNGVRGGHSPNVVNNANPNYAVEVIRQNPDGTNFVQFYHQFPDGTLAKLKKSTVFPDSWSDEKIISSIKKISDTPPVGSRTSDGVTTTLHSGTVDGVEIDVIKEGNNITAGYPVGGKPTPGFEPIN
ncbi:EndoU domain-containing protein [Paenibacillus lautus]|uniref:EndoU domain-containing protein n=1 Tax=Paenibacillus lautus TaxID=1401 RepID=UPI003D2A640A